MSSCWWRVLSWEDPSCSSLNSSESCLLLLITSFSPCLWDSELQLLSRLLWTAGQAHPVSSLLFLLFFGLDAAWLNEGRCPGGRPSVKKLSEKSQIHWKSFSTKATNLKNNETKSPTTLQSSGECRGGWVKPVPRAVRSRASWYADFFFFAGAVRAWSSDGHQYILFWLAIPPYERKGETII